MTLYHYCSNETFVSIATNKTLRLSSLSLSNDTLEGRLVKTAIRRLAEADGLREKTIERLEETFIDMEELFDGLGFCLSEEGDLLSQWRGYADDAHGVSIGFNKDYLEALSKQSSDGKRVGFALRRVEYDPDKHLSSVKPTYDLLRPLIDQGALRAASSAYSLLIPGSDEEREAELKRLEQLSKQLRFQALGLVHQLFQLKSGAFKEEREWRLVSLWLNKYDEEASFRASRNRIIPFREFAIEQLSMPIIDEVIIGPKNITPLHVVESMLRSAGFNDSSVRKSDASYR